MDENKILITTDDGQEKEMTIEFTFDSDEYGKSYVLFFDENSEETELFCMSYDEEGNLNHVTDEKEWDMIAEVIEAFYNEEEDEA